jgi:hypothetical protein
MKPLPPRETAYPLGNLDALHAIRESYDELWVLGDIVNYGPEPREALEGSRRPSSSRGRRVCYLGGHCSACCLGVVRTKSASLASFLDEVPGRHWFRGRSVVRGSLLREILILKCEKEVACRNARCVSRHEVDLCAGWRASRRRKSLLLTLRVSDVCQSDDAIVETLDAADIR